MSIRFSLPSIDNNTIQSHKTEQNSFSGISPRSHQQMMNQQYYQVFNQQEKGIAGGNLNNSDKLNNNNGHVQKNQIQENKQINQKQNMQNNNNNADPTSQQKNINGLFQKNVVLNEKNELKFNLQILKPYNPTKVPPDWNTAKRHGEATRVGMDRKPQSNQPATYEICPCCDNQIEKEKLSTLDDPLKLLFLGSGYPLYFDFITQCIYILLIILFISGGYNLYTNFHGHECLKKSNYIESEEYSPYEQKRCHDDFISRMTFINKVIDQQYIYIQDILDYFTVLILIFMFIWFRKKQIDIDIKCDVLDLTPSDYTVMIKDIPRNVTPNALKVFLQELNPAYKSYYSKPSDNSDNGNPTQDESEKSDKIEVTEINYVYIKNHNQVERLEQEIKKFQQKVKRYNFHQSESQFQIQQQNETLDQDYLALERILYDVERDPSNFNGYAFVSFMSDKQRDSVLSCAINKQSHKTCSQHINHFLFSSSLEEYKQLDFDGNILQICKAPEPLEIVWDNIMIDDKKKREKRVHSFLYTVFSLFLYTVIIYFLNYQGGGDVKNPAPKNDIKNKTSSRILDQLSYNYINETLNTAEHLLDQDNLNNISSKQRFLQNSNFSNEEYHHIQKGNENLNFLSVSNKFNKTTFQKQKIKIHQNEEYDNSHVEHRNVTQSKKIKNTFKSVYLQNKDETFNQSNTIQQHNKTKKETQNEDQINTNKQKEQKKKFRLIEQIQNQIQKKREQKLIEQTLNQHQIKKELQNQNNLTKQSYQLKNTQNQQSVNLRNQQIKTEDKINQQLHENININNTVQNQYKLKKSILNNTKHNEQFNNQIINSNEQERETQTKDDDTMKPNQEDDNTLIQLLKDQFSNLKVSMFMILLNSLVVKNAFEFIVNNECYNTFSLYKINMAYKLSIALFISNALVTTFISIVYSHNIYGNGGLIYIMIFYLALDTPTNCITEMIDIQGLYKKMKRYWYQRMGKSCPLDQQQANELCEMPVHEIEIFYAEIINTMYISVFYSPILPVGMILSLFGLIFFYWVQKYSIIYKRTVKQQISIKLSQEMTNSLEVIVAIFPISNTLFHFLNNGHVTLLQVISILFGLIYVLIPSELLIKTLFKFDDAEQEQQSYHVAYSRFKTTYARLNPITAEIANTRHYDKYNRKLSNQPMSNLLAVNGSLGSFQ